jgi:queuine/archaeosine tRNA-ribosyltransferase
MLAKIKPEYIFTTYSGTLYNLTPENQAPLGITNVHFIFGDVLRLHETLARLPDSLSPKQFYKFTDKQVYLSSVDSTAKRSRGCDDHSVVEIDNFGFRKVKNEQYLTIGSLLKPDVLVALTEEPRLEPKGKKSMKRNIAKSLKFLAEAIEFKKKTGTAWKLLAPWQGAFFMDLRKTHFEGIEALKESIDGIVVHGLYDMPIVNQENGKELGNGAKENGAKAETKDEADMPEAELTKHAFRKQVLQMARSILTQNQTLLLASDGDPIKVLETIREGVSHFESSFPFNLARIGRAWEFDPAIWKQLTHNLIQANYLMTENMIDQIFEDNTYQPKSIDLNDPAFAKSLIPLVPNCTCYTCTHFTRAYINHLLAHHEMTANVLLSIHNAHLYRLFFEYLASEEFSAHSSKATFAFLNFFAAKTASN